MSPRTHVRPYRSSSVNLRGTKEEDTGIEGPVSPKVSVREGDVVYGPGALVQGAQVLRRNVGIIGRRPHSPWLHPHPEGPWYLPGRTGYCKLETGLETTGVVGRGDHRGRVSVFVGSRSGPRHPLGNHGTERGRTYSSPNPVSSGVVLGDDRLGIEEAFAV